MLLYIYWDYQNLEDEIQKKVYKNSKREYKVIDGVNTRIKEFDGESER